MKNEWRPIAEWNDFIAEWEAQTAKRWRGETSAPITSWVAFGFPGKAENEREPVEDQVDWVFAKIGNDKPFELLTVTDFPLSVHMKSGKSPCRCMSYFWEDAEMTAGCDVILYDGEHAVLSVKNVMRPWTPPFTHFCPVFLPPVPGTPYAHNARIDGTQPEHLTTDGAEPPANSAS
jgi:hypothetical protein